MSNVLTFPYGGLRSVLEAIGDEYNELAGQRITRLVGAHAEGDTTIDVETTLDWPDAGLIYMDGDGYTYTSKVSGTPAQLVGLQSPGYYLPGLKRDLSNLTSLVDASGTYSGLDVARRMLFVDYAEGEYLDVIGRNYGVDRPSAMSDDTFRTVLKILAYLPKGTTHGLELLLDAMVGPGLYRIFENLVTYPNRIFIQFDASLFANAIWVGKGYFNSQEPQTSATALTVTVDFTPVGGIESVYGVYLAPETHVAGFDVLPSAEADTPWTYSGGIAEGTFATDNGDGSFSLVDADAVNTARYTRTLRAELETEIVATWRMRVNSASAGEDAVALRANNSARGVAVGWDGTNVHLYAGGAPIAGTAFAVGTIYHDYRLIIPGTSDGSSVVELYVDGVLVATAALSAFDVSAARSVEFGSFTAGETMNTDWTYVQVTTEDPRHNYWNAHELTDGNVASAEPFRLNSTGTLFVAANDVPGRRIQVRKGTAAHGRNNGTYQVDAVDAGGTYVDLTGVPHSAGNGTDAATALAADRVTVDDTWDVFTAEDVGAQATLQTGLVASSNAIDWTAVYGGAEGDNITVELTAAGALQVVVVDPGTGFTEAIQVTYVAGVTTAAALIAAIEVNPAATALVNVTNAGTSNGAGFVTAVATTPLAGGEDGKQLLLDGSGLSNDGVYDLATRIDALTVLVGSHRNPAGLVVETGLDWRKDPRFSTEAGLEWELSGVGTLASKTLTLRRALPAATTDVVVLYTTVLSGQVLENEFTANAGNAFYPLYLADPFAKIRALVDAITVAGVVPLFGE